MFSLDRWQEVLQTLARAKLRSALTAFAVAWGIFMLVALLGFGHGLRKGTETQFADDAANSVWIFGGQTSQPYQGMPVGRRIVFTNADYDNLRKLAGIERLTGRFFPGGGRPFSGDRPVRVGAKTQSFDIRAVHPDHLYLEKTLVRGGRFVNDADLIDRRKVAVVGIPVAQFFWNTTDVIGRTLEIGGVSFQIVGVFDDAGGDDGELRMIYVPVTTAQLAWNGADRLNALLFTVGDKGIEETQELLDQVKVALAERQRFNPADPQAVRVRNNLEQYETFQEIYRTIDTFVSVAGLASLIAGVIGVANIMLITVKERTKEIGIRKALGAPPRSIVGAIMQESIFITTAAGYLGLVAGVGLLSLVASAVPDNEFFGQPQIDFSVAIYANLILIVAGAMAGFFPAYAAAKISPVEAMRDT
ncbi:MAG: ABC transporter permease [Kofleriaceae bacterium]|jgi:putative ABC transport system permease protein|nr:ABC transporter permease [Kofleriaceae bacterium]MBP9170508.1 ABC transporter permease [Kofleriaceae bacterium]MBP9860841.1 ABC transporter permease [Kofleriaceae bacterium]